MTSSVNSRPGVVSRLCLVLALGWGCSSEPDQPQASPTPPSNAGGGAGLEALVEVPDPLAADNPALPTPSLPAPAPGASVDDAAFGTRQTRVTAALGIRHEYSRHDPFNSDGSLVLLLDTRSGEWRVHRTASLPYDQDSNLLRAVGLEEPRWDATQAGRIWGTREFRIETLDVESGASSVVKDFAADPAVAATLAANPDLYRITMKDEGESSTDKRYWAFLLQGSAEDDRARFILVWDRDADRVLAQMPLTASQSEIDWVGMSPHGSSVLIGGSEANGEPLTGLVMADRALSSFQRIDWATAHADVGVDSDGREVVVMQNVRTDHIDLVPLEAATRPILDSGGSYAGTNRVALVRLNYSSSPTGFGSGVHVSCNVPGWCVVSTYIEPGVPEQNWLDRKIVLVRLDRARPRAYYLAHVYGTRGEYWEETHATISRDGSRVLWASNWGEQVGSERVWLMELRMPGGWR